VSRATGLRRSEFPALRTGIHLLSHSLGPMPRGARAAAGAYLREWEGQILEEPWSSRWWGMPRAVGDAIAAILGAPAGTVQVQPNTSVALAAVASCFDFRAGRRRRVVTGGLDFPTTGYLWEALRAAGAEPVVVPSGDGLRLSEERVIDAIDERTALVSLSHVSYRSSHRIDPRPIVEKARRVGAMTLFDVYQSAGVLPLEVAAWGADFAIGGTIKWLCGGPACGYLYVRPDRLAELRPRLTGWFAHEEPFAFAPPPIRYAADARRFAQGTPPVPALHACLPGLRLVAAIGLPAIAAASRRLSRRLIDGARGAGFALACPDADEERGGAVMIAVDEPEAAVARLRRDRILADWRPGVGLRFGPHFFNTEEEIDEAVRALAGRGRRRSAPRRRPRR
jgi:kynureninase